MPKIELVLAIGGLLVNLVWTVVNLRIDALLSRRIETLKDELDQKYVPMALCDERHRCRYPAAATDGGA